MLLRQLIHGIPRAIVHGSLDLPIASLEYDSRRVMPGTVFFALPGTPRDGHDYIAAALKRGATAVVYQRLGFLPPRATVIRVPDIRRAWAQASAAFYGHPSEQLTVIGVTGGTSRTSAAFLTRQLLQRAGIPTGLIGSIRHEIGERILPVLRAMPEVLDTQQLMAAMVRASCDACVIEVRSDVASRGDGAEVDFDVGVFTGGARDEEEGPRAGHRHAESRFPVFLSKQANARLEAAVFDADDHASLALGRGAKARRSVTYGSDLTAQVRVLHQEPQNRGTRLRMLLLDRELESWVPLLGADELRGLWAAVAVGVALGVAPAAVRWWLGNVMPVPGRLEGLECGQPFGVFIDRAHTERALEQALRTLRRAATGRLLVACGGSAGQNAEQRARLGQTVARLADYTVVTTDNPGHEAPETIAASIVRGHCVIRTNDFQVELDRRQAIDHLIQCAQPGDTVLIAGKGHETYQESADTIAPFDDRVYARESLERLGFNRVNRAPGA